MKEKDHSKIMLEVALKFEDIYLSVCFQDV
jgi:hypothetical protein